MPSGATSAKSRAGNIPPKEAERHSKDPMVASATPLALGDSYKGFRIVGTGESFLAPGATFTGAHGIAESRAMRAAWSAR
jgi:hypothetical protein